MQGYIWMANEKLFPTNISINISDVVHTFLKQWDFSQPRKSLLSEPFPDTLLSFFPNFTYILHYIPTCDNWIVFLLGICAFQVLKTVFFSCYLMLELQVFLHAKSDLSFFWSSLEVRGRTATCKTGWEATLPLVFRGQLKWWRASKVLPLNYWGIWGWHLCC